jgi:hypothetical protein
MSKPAPPLSLTPAQQAAVDALCEHDFRFARRSKHAIQDEVDGRPFNDEEHHLHYACRHCGLATVVDANEGPVPPPVPDDAPWVVLVRGIISRDSDYWPSSPAESLDLSVEGILANKDFRYTLWHKNAVVSPIERAPSVAALAAAEDKDIVASIHEARAWVEFFRSLQSLLSVGEMTDELRAMPEKCLLLPHPKNLARVEYVCSRLVKFLEYVAPTDDPVSVFLDAVEEFAAGIPDYGVKRFISDGALMLQDNPTAFHLAAWLGVQQALEEVSCERNVSILIDEIDDIVANINEYFIDFVTEGVDADDVDRALAWLVDWDYEAWRYVEGGSGGDAIRNVYLSDAYGRYGDSIFVLCRRRAEDGSHTQKLKEAGDLWYAHVRGEYYQYRIERLDVYRPSDLYEDGWVYVRSAAEFLEVDVTLDDSDVRMRAREALDEMVAEVERAGGTAFAVSLVTSYE